MPNCLYVSVNSGTSHRDSANMYVPGTRYSRATCQKCERSRLSAPDGRVYEYRWELSQPFGQERIVLQVLSAASSLP